LDGFSAAASARQISQTDFVSVTRDVTLRLFRTAQYPPLRGTFLSAGDRLHFLYTRGSVEFYRTYPGLYVPRPLEFRCDKTGETPKHLAREMLALSKLNWHVSQFDQAYPITVGASGRRRGPAAPPISLPGSARHPRLTPPDASNPAVPTG